MLPICVLVDGPFLKEKGGRRVGKREKRRGKRREEGGKERRGGRRKEEGGKGKKRGGKGKKRGGKEKKKRKRRSAIIHAAAAHAFTVFFFYSLDPVVCFSRRVGCFSQPLGLLVLSPQQGCLMQPAPLQKKITKVLPFRALCGT